MFGGCALKASCRAEELFAFSGSVRARHSREPPGNAGSLKSLPRATKKARQGRAGIPQRSCGARGLREEGEQALSCKEPGGLFAACELKNAPFSGAFLDRARVLPREKDRLKKRGVRLPADARKMSLAPTRRREEDVRRLRLESVVPRGGTVRVFGLGVRASLARTSGECRISQISSPRHEKSPPRAGRSVAQRRGFEPPDESPPSHDFQSCSLNHSDISAKPCNHIIFPQKRQLILRAFRQKVFGNFLIPPMRGRRGKKREKHASKRVKSCKKAEEFDIRLCRCVLSCYKKWEERLMKIRNFPAPLDRALSMV